MRGVDLRALGMLAGAAAFLAASCGWPDVGFREPDTGAVGGVAGAAGAEDTGGTASGTAGKGGATSGGVSGTTGEAGAPPDTCLNSEQDGSETDVDCGGGECPRCAPGRNCRVSIDCVELICTSQNICEPPRCNDDTANDDETDTDCGGPTCDARCAAGQMCREDMDCETRLCVGSRCVTTACEPGTTICGSSDCPCENDRPCITHAECASGNCAGGTCAEGPLAFARTDAPGPPMSGPELLPVVLIRNGGPSALDLRLLTLRYYFSSDSVTQQRGECDPARVVFLTDCDGIRVTLFVTPGAPPGADSFAEVGFADVPGAMTLPSGGQTPEIPIRVYAQDGNSYDPSDDYSATTEVAFAESRRVTLHYGGVLIWGDPP